MVVSKTSTTNFQFKFEERKVTYPCGKWLMVLTCVLMIENQSHTIATFEASLVDTKEKFDQVREVTICLGVKRVADIMRAMGNLPQSITVEGKEYSL